MSQRRTALLWAFDKTGLEDFAKSLIELDFDILALTGTAKYLNERGILARDVAEIAGTPMLGHRVVALSREIYVGLLATETEEDQAELDRLGIPRIDLVYVNLHPLREEILVGPRLSSVIEKTDIEGPALLRYAAKGRRIVLTNPDHLLKGLSLARDESSADPDDRARKISFLVYHAEKAVADYCALLAEYHGWFSKGWV